MSGQLVGYARVSSGGQSLDVQTGMLADAGCIKVFAEKKSGLSADGRSQLADCLDYVRDGDTLIVTRLDRLARSVGDLFRIIERLQAKRVSFRCLQQSGVDTDCSTGRLMLAILGAVAAFEADLRKERQAEGIAKAKAAGVYSGRKATIDGAMIQKMFAEGERPTAIAKKLGIGRASVYRYLAGSP